MLVISLIERSYDRGSREFVERLAAQFELVDGSLERLTGDVAAADLQDIVVVDPADGTDVTMRADPMRWARLLPQAFRSGAERVVIHETATGALAIAKREVAALAAGVPHTGASVVR